MTDRSGELQGSISEHVLEPGTGKAVSVRRGQVMRLEQVLGGQCADVNIFNLRDYKERFSAARTREIHGSCPSLGDSLWSGPPRDRPLMTIISDTFKRNDVLFERCSAFIYEYLLGITSHTNCQDIQAEAQREFGLTPDDVHSPFNAFSAVGFSPGGRPVTERNTSKPGDHIEFLAQIDVLAVPNVCGSDVRPVSNFSLKPLRLSIREASATEKAQWLVPTRQYANQRSVDSFTLQAIKPDRALVRDPTYTPLWPNYPIQVGEVEIEFTPLEYELVNVLRSAGRYGIDDESVILHALFSWLGGARRRERGDRGIPPVSPDRPESSKSG